MSGRQMRYKPPAGYRVCPKLRRDYEKHGKALGRLYLWHPEEAIKAWKMLGGVLGAKWKLEVYRYHYCKDNPKDYAFWKDRQRTYRKRKQRNLDHDRLGG